MKNLGFAAAVIGVLGLASVGATQSVGPRPAVPEGLQVWLTGSSADTVVDQRETGPAILLMGGGGEVDKAFAERAYRVINGGNIVVLRTSGTNGYQNYFWNLSRPPGVPRPASVETMRVTTREFADSDYVAWVLAGAEMIWMAGGDQSTYTENWRGTKVQEGLQAAWERGAVIGGTSAGMAVMASLIYDPGDESSLTTAQALSDPFHRNLILSDRLLEARWMDDVMTDTHFRNRDRMGRTMTMMARARLDGRMQVARAVCLSEGSAVFIDRNGLGTVDLRTTGDAMYVLQEYGETVSTQVERGQPTIYGPVLRYRLTDGMRFDFANWSTTAVLPMALSIDGTNEAQPYSPADPYADAPLLEEIPNDGAKTTSWLMNGASN
jgi:cyanophycinase-like exopeptidase